MRKIFLIINLFVFYIILNDIYIYTCSIEIVIQESSRYSVSILYLTRTEIRIDGLITRQCSLPIMRFE